MGYESSTNGFVEYYIKATLVSWSAGWREEEEAILPITLIDKPTAPPVVNFGLTQRRRQMKVSSFKLLPNMESTSLSFTQRRQQMFSSNKVPQIGGRMEVDLPAVVQLDNPNPIPVNLRFVPLAETTSSSMCGIPAKIELLDFAVAILSRTLVLSSRVANSMAEDSIKLQVWPTSRSVRAAGVDGSPIYIPCGDEWPALDVGERCLLVMRRLQRMNDLNKKYPLRADFQTYSIKHWHKMSFEFIVGFGGEKIKMGWTERVRILPPSDDRCSSSRNSDSSSQIGENAVEGSHLLPQPRSESWIRPPDLADAPPSFAEVQREDILRRSQDGRTGAST
ncbi:hypothetical protein B0T11DRAFT_291124 [Plectosphaerella cucumerina]|uniref:Uncharacterized protein n=1 Tax=Plectosphaerella cucumerina TaxID=40658 RepID=A0A8K0T9Z0_9PEZI|nr:hypothetical protein B0T11DRAFT_291124 [Plectosphaerella cucumerina]